MSIHHSISENGSGLWTFQNHSDVHLEFYADGTTIVVFDDPQEGNPKMRSLMTNEDTINAYKKDTENLRQSVRRLVGEWQLTSEALKGAGAEITHTTYERMIGELSALIDGKGEKL